MVRFAPKHLDGNYGLFDLVIAAFQMAFGEEPEESAHALIAKESRARQDPIPLPAPAVGVCRRDGHGFEYTSCFQRCANVCNMLSTCPDLLFFPARSIVGA